MTRPDLAPWRPHRPRQRKRIAVIGSGIAGLGAAWALRDTADVTLFEAGDRLGGHSHTVEVEKDGRRAQLDIGFIVFTPPRYPNFTRLMDTLGVDTVPTEMSYGYSEAGGPEFCTSIARGGFLARKRSAVSPEHLGMIGAMLRFVMSAERDLAAGVADGLDLRSYLRAKGFGPAFERRFLLPMAGAIWSASEEEMLEHDAASFLRFFVAHGLTDFVRPQWRVLRNQSQDYVRRIAATLPDIRLNTRVRGIRRPSGGVLVDTGGIPEWFDDVILACHSDQALRLLRDANDEEAQFLGAVRYRPNRAVLHSDPSLAPTRKRALACWNARRPAPGAPCYYTYDMNQLQHIRDVSPIFLTLNPPHAPDPALTHGEYDFEHPSFSAASYPAQRRFNRIQGVRRTWFAGAWLGYGFHEDGLRAGLRVALRLGGKIPWAFVEGDVDGGPYREPWPERTPAAAIPAE